MVRKAYLLIARGDRPVKYIWDLSNQLQLYIVSDQKKLIIAKELVIFYSVSM